MDDGIDEALSHMEESESRGIMEDPELESDEAFDEGVKKKRSHSPDRPVSSLGSQSSASSSMEERTSQAR